MPFPRCYHPLGGGQSYLEPDEIRTAGAVCKLWLRKLTHCVLTDLTLPRNLPDTNHLAASRLVHRFHSGLRRLVCPVSVGEFLPPLLSVPGLALR